jgi:arsenate reductase (glutaredoxin)
VHPKEQQTEIDNTMLTIYHNPRCKKSREALQYLVDHHIPHTVVEYLKTPLALQELKLLLMKLNRKPQEIVRTKEAIFKKELKGRNFTEEEWLSFLLKDSCLIIRPIVAAKHKAVIAIPPVLIEGLL